MRKVFLGFFIRIADFTEGEPEIIKKFYTHLVKVAKKEKTIFETHSLDEANENAQQKNQRVLNKSSNKNKT